MLSTLPLVTGFLRRFAINCEPESLGGGALKAHHEPQTHDSAITENLML